MEPKSKGLAAGTRFYAEQLRAQALEVELMAMTPDERTKNAVRVAKDVIDEHRRAEIRLKRQQHAKAMREKKTDKAKKRKADVLAAVTPKKKDKKSRIRLAVRDHKVSKRTAQRIFREKG